MNENEILKLSIDQSSWKKRVITAKELLKALTKSIIMNNMKTMESQNIFLKLFQDDFKISLLKSINKAFNIVQPS